MPGPEGYTPPVDDTERAKQWEADRATEAAPAPYANLTHYENESQRQESLASAEQSNIARAAGELGLTTTEWHDLRSKLGRSPQRGDVGR